jgi:hypothetical protein
MLELSNAEIFRLMAHTYLNGKKFLNLRQFYQEMKKGEIADLGNVRLDYLKISLLSNSSGLAIVNDCNGELIITREDKVVIDSKRVVAIEIFPEKFTNHKELALSKIRKAYEFSLHGNYIISRLFQSKIGAISLSHLEKGEIFFSPYYVLN